MVDQTGSSSKSFVDGAAEALFEAVTDELETLLDVHKNSNQKAYNDDKDALWEDLHKIAEIIKRKNCSSSDILLNPKSPKEAWVVLRTYRFVFILDGDCLDFSYLRRNTFI